MFLTNSPLCLNHFIDVLRSMAHNLLTRVADLLPDTEEDKAAYAESILNAQSYLKSQRSEDDDDLIGHSRDSQDEGKKCCSIL